LTTAAAAGVLAVDRVKYDAEADNDGPARRPAAAGDLRPVSHGFIAAVVASTPALAAARGSPVVVVVVYSLRPCVRPSLIASLGNFRSAYVRFTYVQRLRLSDWLCEHRLRKD